MVDRDVTFRMTKQFGHLDSGTVGRDAKSLQTAGTHGRAGALDRLDECRKYMTGKGLANAVGGVARVSQLCLKITILGIFDAVSPMDTIGCLSQAPCGTAWDSSRARAAGRTVDTLDSWTAGQLDTWTVGQLDAGTY